MEKAFEYGDEFQINGNKVVPAELNKENLLKFTFLILENFNSFHNENVEVQIRSCLDQKAIEWQIKTFYFDKGFCLDKTYTFFLLPNWTIDLFYEHWFTKDGYSNYQRHISNENDIETLKMRIGNFLKELTIYYHTVGRPAMSNRFLNSANWKVIYAKSIKEDQTKVAERRIHEYLKFIAKPIINFKD
ncbi:MAG TPA: hypothetical protein VLB84_09320 [Bacteroidia bacterium]|nr:hypothetical protein [Bacteroidia bacterium]